MKPISEKTLKVCRWIYVILFCILLGVLISNNVLSSKWMLYAIGIVGVGLIYLIEHFLKKISPEIFPPSDKEKEVEKMLNDIDEGRIDERDEMVKSPRTVIGTLCEIVVVGIIGYALYRAWTLDQRMLGVVLFSALAIGTLITSYYTDIKKKYCEPSDLGGVIAVSNNRHVTALFAALVTLILTYFYDPGTYYKWRALYFSCGLLFALMIPIQYVINKRSAALMAKVNNYDPRNISVTRTIEATAFETAAVLLLIGGWCAAAIKHQLTDKGILDIPVADLIMCSAFSIGFLILAYFPTWLNSATTFKSDKQVLGSIRRCRISAVVIALFGLILPFILPELDEKTLDYLYVAVLIVISICNFFFISDKENNTTNSK